MGGEGEAAQSYSSSSTVLWQNDFFFFFNFLFHFPEKSFYNLEKKSWDLGYDNAATSKQWNTALVLSIQKTEYTPAANIKRKEKEERKMGWGNWPAMDCL